MAQGLPVHAYTVTALPEVLLKMSGATLRRLFPSHIESQLYHGWISFKESSHHIPNRLSSIWFLFFSTPHPLLSHSLVLPLALQLA